MAHTPYKSGGVTEAGYWVTKLKWHNAYGFKLTLCVGHSRMTSMLKEVIKKCVVKKIFETVSPWMDIGVWTICRQNQFSTPVLLRENITFKKDVAFLCPKVVFFS